jgi:hypothetical protein
MSSTLIRIGRNGGYHSSRRASDKMPLRDANRINLAIQAISIPPEDWY